MAQYELEKAERERIASEEAAAKANEEELARLRTESETASSSASSYGYEIGAGSPSPAAKARAEKKTKDYAIFDQYSHDQIYGWRARADAKVRAHEEAKKLKPKPVEDPNDPYVKRRKKLEREDAMIKRIAASTTPMFIRSNTDVAYLEATEAARQEERRSRGIPEPTKTEAELDPTWGTRTRGYPSWAKKIMHPEMFDEEVALLVDDNVIAMADQLLPSIEVLSKHNDFARPLSAPSAQNVPRLSQPQRHLDNNYASGESGTHIRTSSAPSYGRDYMDTTTHGSPTSSPSLSPAKSPTKDRDSLWNGELEFTNDSIEVSMSPQLKIRRLDAMREQELNNESARGRATTQLERIRERNSEERSYQPEGYAKQQSNDVDPDLGDISEFVAKPYVSELEQEINANADHHEIDPDVGDVSEYVLKPYISELSPEAGGKLDKLPGPKNAILKKSPEANAQMLAKENNKTTENISKPSIKQPSPDIGEGVQIPNTPVTIYDARSYHKKHPSKSEEEIGRIREESYDALRALSRSISRSPDNHMTNSIKHETNNLESNIATTSSITANETSRKTTIEKANDKKTTAAPSKIISTTKSEEPISDTKIETTNLRPLKDTHTQSRPNSLSRSDVDPEERIAAEAKLFELQDNMSAKNSTRAPSPPPSDEESDDFEIVEETPKPKIQDPLTMPTPRIMGAFIETPAPTVRKPRIDEDVQANDLSVDVAKTDNKDHNTTKLTATAASTSTATADKTQALSTRARPPLINTAPKFSVADDIRRLKAEAGIDDSIDDFDSFMGKPVVTDLEDTNDVPGSPMDELISGILKDKSLFDKDTSGRSLSAKERERRLEEAIMDRMNKHLAKTSSSIRDTRHGIERIEKQVQTTIGKPSALVLAGNKDIISIPVAEKADDGTIYIKIPVPSLWRYTPEIKGQQHKLFSRNWKFTWFGFFLAIFFSWYIAEEITCYTYCKPEYANEYTIWYGDETYFPTSLPFMLDKWTGNVASEAWYTTWEIIDDWQTGQHNRGKRHRGYIPLPTRTMQNSGWWRPAYLTEPSPEEKPIRYSMWGDEIVD